MKIGILSDTHGWLHPELRSFFKGVDHIIHAGDIGSMDVLRQLSAIAPTTAVRGNIDGEEFYDLEQIEYLRLCGKRIFVVHNAGEPVRPVYDLNSRILSRPADILISGHYHAFWLHGLKNRRLLWISPGAAGNSGHHADRLALRMEILPEDQQTGDITSDYKIEKINLGKRGAPAEKN